MTFIEQLRQNRRKTGSALCIGLDPRRDLMPPSLRNASQPFYAFCRSIVDATHDLASCYKPQHAFFAAQGAEQELVDLIEYIHGSYPDVPVLLDAKRGDVGSTSAAYAEEAFVRYGADAVTVSPYLGRDAIEPFLQWSDRGVFVLCRTSNEGAGEIQDLSVGGRPLYLHVASHVARHWNSNGNVGLVTGATHPNELAEVRAAAPGLPLLIPGVGAQGGDVARAVVAGRDGNGEGILVSASRSIIFADRVDESFAAASRKAASALHQEIASALAA